MPKPKPMTVLNFAVVGASGAGKSTFIKCALDLSKPATSASSTKKMSLEGELFRITLMEIQLIDVTIQRDRDIEWPENIGSKLTPKVDGVLALYDISDRSSLSVIPALMSEYACSDVFFGLSYPAVQPCSDQMPEEARLRTVLTSLVNCR